MFRASQKFNDDERLAKNEIEIIAEHDNLVKKGLAFLPGFIILKKKTTSSVLSKPFEFIIKLLKLTH